uniref:Salivary lipocalin n=1 Tax=Ornithodoros coriaceus TaxID=92741 RepID=B2D2E3_ORNCO|nr:salivary lipocalin [Ornithodoros coriaceus]
MNLKLVFAFALIGAQLASPKKVVDEAKAKQKDIWKAMSRSDVFFLLRRTYRWSGDRCRCVYMRILERNETSHTFFALSGKYNQSQPVYTRHPAFVTARKEKKGSSQMVFSPVGYDGAGITYELLFDDGKNCSVLRITNVTVEFPPTVKIGGCELWATQESARYINVESPCEVKYFKLCNPSTNIEDTPYEVSCLDPPKSAESLPIC